MGTMKQAIGYVRVSTEGQVADGVSLQAQQARIAAWCIGNGYELVKVFSDSGISGKRADNRPELQAALAAVESSGGILVVYSLSRLARSTKDTIAISERLDRAGADLVSLSERIDTTSAAGRMIFRMLAVLAEFERDQISERVTTALSYKSSQGERVGQIPFGYQLDDDGIHLLPNDQEQAVLATIASLRREGVSYRGIADHLNERGIASKTGGQWFASSVRSVICTRKAA